MLNASGLRRKIVHIVTQAEAPAPGFVLAGTAFGTVCWDTDTLPGNDSNAVTEGALEKSRVIQTMEIYADFWGDFYFDETEDESSMCG